jgi:uncharacterized protein (DUF1919 family)
MEYVLMRSIVTNNCWGSGFYQEQQLPYNTPFVGLFFIADHYLRLLSNFRPNMARDLYFPAELNDGSRSYPIGRLTDLIDIHFVHYKTADEAAEKWVRRTKRLPSSDDDILFKICDRDKFEQRHIAWFNNLLFRNKILFTKLGRFNQLPDYGVQIESGDTPYCPDGVTLWKQTRGTLSFDLDKWMLSKT